MIQFPAILDSLKMNKDTSLTIKLETREMSPDEVGKIASLANNECWVGMSEVVISKLDVPEEISEFKGEKSLSERLRSPPVKRGILKRLVNLFLERFNEIPTVSGHPSKLEIRFSEQSYLDLIFFGPP